MTISEPNPITDQVRAMIQWAYSEQPGVDGSIFEIFSGRKTVKANLKPSRRSAGLSPTRVHATATPREGKARIPISSGRSGGEIKRAVATLPAMEQNWVHHCYNPSRERKMAATAALVPALWAKYKEQILGSRSHNRTAILALFMLKLQMQQARSYPGLSKWSPSRPEEFAPVVSRSSWSDTHSARWEGIHKMILALDHQALMGVYRAMEKK